jgi:hypothetical protein
MNLMGVKIRWHGGGVQSATKGSGRRWCSTIARFRREEEELGSGMDVAWTSGAREALFRGQEAGRRWPDDDNERRRWSTSRQPSERGEEEQGAKMAMAKDCGA